MKKIYLGIDGGATKYKAVLISSDGQVLAWAQASGMVLQPISSSSDTTHIASIVSQVCKTSGHNIRNIAGFGLCLSGVDFANEIPMQKKLISRALGVSAQKTELVNDAFGALWGSTPCNPAAIVQHGTAFTASWRSSWGNEHLFDHLDTGAIFDIRRHLPTLLARMLDGRHAVTPLLGAMLRHFGLAKTTFSEALYKNHIPRKLLANTPPLVFKAWLRKDAAATELVDCAARDYACTAQAMLLNTPQKTGCAVFGGGVINCAPDSFLDLIRFHLSKNMPKVDVIRPIMDPCLGAALMAAHHNGEDTRFLFESLDLQYKKHCLKKGARKTK